jgi:hypothetical protein
MPKPDAAGRTFPVQSPSLPTPVPAQTLPEIMLLSTTTSQDHLVKSRRDYWAIAFAAPLIAAILLLGWKVEKIFWGVPASVQKQNLGSVRTASIVPETTSPKFAPNGGTSSNPHTSANTSRAKAAIKNPASSPAAAQKEVGNRSAAGPVVIRALVGRDGKVQLANVIRGNRKLSVPALAMVRQLTFNPYAPHGTPLEFETEVTVSEAGARGSSEGIQFSIPRESEKPQPPATPVAAEKPSK